ncbi:hypothetical protein STEG23_009590 [Scotinomys teguina]
MDKFASIRIPGSRKERPPLPNLKTASGSSDRSSVSSETMENIPKPLSENEVLKLFEKMMLELITYKNREVCSSKLDLDNLKGFWIFDGVYVELLLIDSKIRHFNCVVFEEDVNLNEDKKSTIMRKRTSVSKMVMQYVPSSKTVLSYSHPTQSHLLFPILSKRKEGKSKRKIKT